MRKETPENLEKQLIIENFKEIKKFENTLKIYKFTETAENEI